MTQIISVGSYRRAVGKSIIAANLAAQASLLGWRVGIAELNFLYPFFEIPVFDIPNSTGSLADYLHGKTAVEAVGADVFASQDEGSGLWIFPWGEPEFWGKEEIDPEDLSQRLQALGAYHHLDFLILDLGAGLTDVNLLMAAISDCCLIVTRADHMDYQGTAIMVDLVRALDDDPWVLLIANQVLGRYDSGQVREQITGIFHAPTCVLPFSETILEASGDGFFSLRAADHPWSRAVRSISASLFSDLAGRPGRPASSPSILSRRLNSVVLRPRPDIERHELPKH